MELKELTIKDIDLIEKIIADAFSGEPWNDEWQDSAQLRQYIADVVDNKNSLSLGLFDNDKIIGVTTGRIKHWFTGKQYWIDDLGILSEKQGSGAGTSFISMIEEYLKENGVNKIVLLTERDFPAYRFYAKNGFVDKENRVVYEKELAVTI